MTVDQTRKFSSQLVTDWKSFHHLSLAILNGHSLKHSPAPIKVHDPGNCLQQFILISCWIPLHAYVNIDLCKTDKKKLMCRKMRWVQQSNFTYNCLKQRLVLKHLQQKQRIWAFGIAWVWSTWDTKERRLEGFASACVYLRPTRSGKR